MPHPATLAVPKTQPRAAALALLLLRRASGFSHFGVSVCWDVERLMELRPS